jgi:dihydrofolate synthase/folylpolyglutamate synthase
VGKEFRYVRAEDGDFDYEGLNRKLWGIHLNLKGFHQVINATTALGAMEVLEDLGYRVSTHAMIDGLKEVDWPGRLEIVSSSPRVILDGAHNPAGALVLKESLEKEFQYQNLILLIGIMKDKDIPSMLHLLAPLAHHIIFTKPHTDRAATPSLLKKALGQNGKKAEIAENLREAIERGLSLTQEEDLLCITGSLYTVGEARAYFHPKRGS